MCCSKNYFKLLSLLSAAPLAVPNLVLLIFIAGIPSYTRGQRVHRGACLVAVQMAAGTALDELASGDATAGTSLYGG